MNEDVIRKNINWRSITEVKSYGQHIFKIKCKWENDVGKTLPLFEAGEREGGDKMKC